MCCSLFPGMIGGGVAILWKKSGATPGAKLEPPMGGSLSCWKGSVIKSSNFVIEAVRGMGQEWV